MKRLSLPVPNRVAAVFGVVFLAGCASFSPDGGLNDVSQLTQERIGQVKPFTKESLKDGQHSATQVQTLLSAPLTPESAVQIALLNNAALKVSFAELGVSEAEFVQAGRMRNPSFSFGRVSGGGDAEIDRSVMFDIVGLLTLPTRRRIEQGRFEQAKLLTAAQAVQLAAETRRAYFMAVAAAQSAAFAGQVRGAAEASSQLADSMTKVGNWSTLDQARERAFYQDALTQ